MEYSYLKKEDKVKTTLKHITEIVHVNKDVFWGTSAWKAVMCK